MSNTVARILAGVVALGTAYARPWRRAQLRLLITERLHQRHRVATPYGPLTFLSTHLRALEAPRNFHVSEPETLAWIDGFAPGAVFWDIGANLGVYSLYAGRRGDLEVLAFEPSPASHAALCANIAENGLDRIRAYCVALGERSRLGTLNMPCLYPGSVYNSFEEQASRDMLGRPLPAASRQAAVGLSADDLVEVFGAPPPNHIKLDVDGTEAAILRGAERLLRMPPLVSVLVETSRTASPQNGAIDALLAAAGFRAAGSGRGGSDYSLNVIYRR